MLICIGLTLELALFHKDTRNGVPAEFKNLKWVLLGQSLAFGGMATLYFAMAGLPATIVSTIAATQPLAVLFLEKLAHSFGIKMCSDERLLSKLLPVSIMVCVHYHAVRDYLVSVVVILMPKEWAWQHVPTGGIGI